MVSWTQRQPGDCRFWSDLEIFYVDVSVYRPRSTIWDSSRPNWLSSEPSSKHRQRYPSLCQLNEAHAYPTLLLLPSSLCSLFCGQFASDFLLL